MPDPVKFKPPWAAQTAADPAADKPAPLLEPEYAGAYHAYAASPGPKTAGPLLAALHPVITEAARSYAGSEAGNPTVLANAKRLALEAVRRYDPDRAKLRTHLLSHLRGLRRQVNRSTSPLYVPEQWAAHGRTISAALPDLRDQLGREPSAAELADHVGLSLDQVRKARAIPGVLASSQAGDAPGVERPDPESWKTWTEAVYLDSSPTDQVILDGAFGLHGRPVLAGNEIAKQLGVSAGAVSQRKARLQQQLDAYDMFHGQTGK